MNNTNAASKFPAWLPLGVAVLALGAAGWAAYDAHTSGEELKAALGTRLGEQAAQQKSAAQSIDTLTRELKDAQNRVREMETKLADYAGQRVALEEMARELARAPDDWLLAEIEQTLNIASRELTLAGNVRAALGALQGADQRLARADKPQMAALRRAIAQDMERLKALPLVDMQGISVKLDALMGLTSTLPLAV
ncbi:MAG: uroporphyrinogen-III C-methyltransferase, partial [Betaproteobacteria bacterium]|nr:uroporphyrinogen-III C-methyltransferase [Betaproteobacteria bacterium]